MIKAESCWEINEIIILVKEDDKFVLNDHLDEDPRYRFGYSNNGYIALSLEKAKELLLDLQNVINVYEQTERVAKEHDEYYQEELRKKEISEFIKQKYDICFVGEKSSIDEEEYNRAAKKIYLNEQDRIGDVSLKRKDIGLLGIESDTNRIYVLIDVVISKINQPKKIQIVWKYLGKMCHRLK
jgi:hypothetical protein